MKHVNAPVSYNKFASIDLMGRRHYANLDTAGIKRDERRTARRSLKSQLHGLCLAVLRQDFTKAPVAPTPEVVQDEMAQFIAPALPADQMKRRDVTVVRKRAGSLRKQSETVSVLQHYALG